MYFASLRLFYCVAVEISIIHSVFLSLKQQSISRTCDTYSCKWQQKFYHQLLICGLTHFNCHSQLNSSAFVNLEVSKASSVDPDQTAQMEQSDLDPYCLHASLD